MKENLIAIIKDGIVDNVIVASDDFANTLPESTVNVTDKNVGKGWKYNQDGTFSHPDTLLSRAELLVKKTKEEKTWRDAELKKSDYMAPLKDHPNYNGYIYYRQALRDYTDNVDFPNGVKPTLDLTIKNALTKFQFMARFTKAERIAINVASKTNSDLSDWLELFKITEEIDLYNQNTIDGITALETAGIIAVGRATEILN